MLASQKLVWRMIDKLQGEVFPTGLRVFFSRASKLSKTIVFPTVVGVFPPDELSLEDFPAREPVEKESVIIPQSFHKGKRKRR